MLRVCGADGEQKALDRQRCWCRGVFCGPGGAKLSAEFRRTFRTSKTAASLVQFEELVCQADLFDGDAQRNKWRERLAPARDPRRLRGIAGGRAGSLARAAAAGFGR